MNVYYSLPTPTIFALPIRCHAIQELVELIQLLEIAPMLPYHRYTQYVCLKLTFGWSHMDVYERYAKCCLTYLHIVAYVLVIRNYQR